MSGQAKGVLIALIGTTAWATTAIQASSKSARAP